MTTQLLLTIKCHMMLILYLLTITRTCTLGSGACIRDHETIRCLYGMRYICGNLCEIQCGLLSFTFTMVKINIPTLGPCFELGFSVI